MVSRGVMFLLVLLTWTASAAAAAEPGRCLNAEDRRAAIAGQQAMPLANAIKAAKSRVRGEIIRARLCYSGQGLVYVLTVLGRDGRVTRVSVDAGSGTLAIGR